MGLDNVLPMKITMKNFTDTVSTQFAKARRATGSSRLLRVLNGRTAATLALGTALSIGGAADALHDVHFMVRKDLDAVRVVKQDGGRSEIVAKLSDGFTANSFFKLSRVLPESIVSHQISLFSDAWIPTTPHESSASRRDSSAIRVRRYANTRRGGAMDG